jgi:hypothetical protein
MADFRFKPPSVFPTLFCHATRQELGMIYIDPPGLHRTYSDREFMADFREGGGMERKE